MERYDLMKRARGRNRPRSMPIDRFFIVPMVLAGLVLAGFAGWYTIMRGLTG